MKKQLTVALGLAVLATPAFATKARLQALGEDTYGSAYINDNRNIWLNAAQINNHKDLVTFEWGTTTTDANTAGQDTAVNPRAEGGVHKAFGNMVYGVHLGSASNTSNALRRASGITDAYEENNIDLFVGGDAGLKWGANLGYTSSAKDESTAAGANQEALRSRLGVIMGDFQAYGNINLANEAKGSTGNKFDGSLGYQVGVIQAWEGNTVFGDWRRFEGEAKTAAGAKNDLFLDQWYAGIGRVERLNDKSNLYLKASYVSARASNEGGSPAFVNTIPGCNQNAALGCRRYTTSRVPVVIGLETEATSWLTLRASVGQVVWGDEANKDKSRPVQESTLVNVGASLKFGELSVDGVIGNSDDTGVVPAGSATQAAGTGTNNGTLRTDVLMTRVGMVYRF